VCAFDREVLGKPGTAQSARQQLRRLSGQAHTLHTAVCVTCNDASEEFLVSTNLWMRELTDDEIERYVEADDPTQCAGSYRIENAGISLFHKIDCEDFTAIVGLPLMQLTEVLRRYGIPVP